MKQVECVEAVFDAASGPAAYAGREMKDLREIFAQHVGSIVNFADAVLIRTRALSLQIAAADRVIAALDLPNKEKLEQNGKLARENLAAAEKILLFEIRRLRAEIEDNPTCEVLEGGIRAAVSRIGS